MSTIRKDNWAVFGKVSALLALIATVITIYKGIFPSAPDLVGQGELTSFAIPPNLAETHDFLSNRTGWSYIHDFLDEKITDESHPKISSKVIQELSDSIQVAFGKNFPYSFQKYRGFVLIHVQNEGNILASDIVLDFPGEGIALITRQDETQSIVEATRTLSLEDLRPGNTVSVAIWTESEINVYYENEFRLTYENGIGSISFAKNYSGFRRFVAENLGFIAYIIVSVSFFTLLFRPKRPSKNNTNDDNEEPIEET